MFCCKWFVGPSVQGYRTVRVRTGLSAWRSRTVRAAPVARGPSGDKARTVVIQGAALEVLLPFLDYPPEGCGLSAQGLRTVRPCLADSPLGDLQDS
jgi:hypothetical protein